MSAAIYAAPGGIGVPSISSGFSSVDSMSGSSIATSMFRSYTPTRSGHWTVYVSPLRNHDAVAVLPIRVLAMRHAIVDDEVSKRAHSSNRS